MLRTKGFVILACALAVGCATKPPRIDGVPPEEGQVALEPAAKELFRLQSPATLVELKGTEDERFYVKYTYAGETHHGYTELSALQDITVHTEWFPVYRFFPIEPEEYPQASDSDVDFQEFPQSQWADFWAYLVQSLTPAEPERGVLINVRDREVFAYRGRDGNVLMTESMYEKPVEVPLTQSYRIEKMHEAIFEIVDAYLSEQQIDARLLAGSTGEVGAYARPFFLIDRKQEKIAFLSLEPFTFGSMPNRYGTTAAKTGTHFVRSYFLEPLNRPVTYVSRLFFLVTDVVRDSVRGVTIRSFGFPGLDDAEIPPVATNTNMDLAAWEKQLDRMVGKSSYTGEVEVLIDGDVFFPRLVETISHAQRSVKIRTYIFDNDDFALGLADYLKKRSHEVDVQIMIDGLGTLMAQNVAAGTMPEDTEIPLGITTYLSDGSEIRVRSLTNPWLTGDHSKTTIVDSETAFIGGMNIGREYRWEWHDVMMMARGQIVDYIEWEFDKTWSHANVLGDFVLAGRLVGKRPGKREPSGYPIRPLVTKPRTSQIYRAQLAAIRNARGYIYVQNAYLSDTTLIYELARARLRGVDVRIIIPLEGNHGIMNKSNVVAANTLLQYGVRVFAYAGMSHIKAAVYDGWACLGSANFDKLSFRINKEMNLSSSAPAFTDQILERIFEPDFEAAVELTKPLPEDWSNTFANIAAAML